MLKSNITALLLVASLCAHPLWGAPAKIDPAKKPFESALIAKGRDYFVHLVPNSATAPAAIGYLATPGPPPPATPTLSDFSLVYTNRSTGSMRLLFVPANNHWLFIGGYDREYRVSTHLTGVVADEQRAYVLVRTDNRSEFKGPTKTVESTSDFVLHVFWLESGDEIFSAPVKTQSTQELASELSPNFNIAFSAGGLQRTSNGISVYGHTFSFNGKKLR